MTGSIQELLRDAAAFVPPPPDGLAHAVRKGRRLRRRATAMRVAVLPVVALAALLVDSSSGRSQRVDVVDVPITTTLAVDSRADGATTVPPGSPRPTTTTVHRGGTVPVVDVPRPTGHPADGPAAVVTAPSEARIAFWEDSTLFTMRTDGTDRRVLLGPGPRPHAWSSDGRTMLVESASGPHAVDALDLATGMRRTIVRVEDATIFSADISPAGDRIAYWTKDDDDVHLDSRPWDHIWVANLDGTGVRELATGKQPSWSPDGTRILFASCTYPGAFTCTIRPDGTDLAGMPIGSYGWPRFSPDGKWIGGFEGPLTLGIIRPDGTGGSRELAEEADSMTQIAWTTDSTSIVFRGEARTVERQGLFKVAIDGTKETRLTNDPGSFYPVAPR